MTTEIIIPAYNEEHRIEKNLRAYLAYFPHVSFFVVLNGCVDHTQDVVRSLQKEFPERVRYDVIPKAIGKGGAVLHGFKKSTAEIVGFVDADGATPPAEYQKLFDRLAGYDGVIASRFMKGATVLERQSILRTIMSHLFLRVVKILFRLPYSDTQCGAKIFYMATLLPVVEKIRCTDMNFDIELLYRLHQRGARIKEVPTVWVDQPGSATFDSHATFMKTGYRMVRALLQLRTQMWRD